METISPAAARRTSTREHHHADTRERIVQAARHLVAERQDLTLRAIARELGLSAPALYRYAASHQDLIRMVAMAIDADVALAVQHAAEAQPADDAAAQLVAGAVAFRQWALSNRHEFALVFTNVDVDCMNEIDAGDKSSGLVFSQLLFKLWLTKRFPLPQLDQLDPGLAAILEDPLVPADLELFSGEARGLVWVMQRAWCLLYGTVSLEVFQHIDPRLVEETHLFRAMMVDQLDRIGLAEERDRLLALVRSLLHD